MNKTIFLLLAIIILTSGCVYSNNTTDIDTSSSNMTNVFEIVGNNTNLAPAVIDHPGTGERVSGTTYYANDYPLQLMVFAHASSISQTATVAVYINDTLVAPQSGRPLGGAEESNRSVVINVPKFSSYRVNFTNYHHYEWREYPILSGRNGTLSVNQTFNTFVNQSNFSIMATGYTNLTTYAIMNSTNLSVTEDSTAHTIKIDDNRSSYPNNSLQTEINSLQNNDTNTLHFINGSYTGDGTQNRHISHSFGKTPVFVAIQDSSVGGSINSIWVGGQTVPTVASFAVTNSILLQGIVMVNSTYITVGVDASGSAMNYNGRKYYYVMWG